MAEDQKVKDGGSAFPAEGGPGSGLHPTPGMSLRDYFAGQALAGLLAAPEVLSPPLDVHRDSRVQIQVHYARIAYDYADAMLAARGGK